MKVTMHELEHCPNCAMVAKILERRFGDDVEIEHVVMDSSDIDRFLAEGLSSSPVVEVDGRLHTASTRQERDDLVDAVSAALSGK